MSILQKENMSKKHPLIENHLFCSYQSCPKIRCSQKFIAQRFQNMIEEGLAEEVENILKIPEVDHDSQSMKSVGYRQVCEFLRERLIMML